MNKPVSKKVDIKQEEYNPTNIIACETKSSPIYLLQLNETAILPTATINLEKSAKF